MLARIRRFVPVRMVGATISTLMPAKVVAKVSIAESSDIAKAAVGFFSTFTANVHPYNYAPNRNYQSTVTLTGEYHEPPILCRNIGQAKHWLERGIRFFLFFPRCLGESRLSWGDR